MIRQKFFLPLLALVLTFGAGGALAGDNLIDATPLGGVSTTVTADSTAATEEAGEPDHAGNRGGASLWWTWTPTQKGDVTISTAGSDFDTLLAVYTLPDGQSLTFANLTATRSNDDSGDLTSQVAFTVSVPNTTYYVAVDGSNGIGGNITLTITFDAAAPDNDAFSLAEVLTGATASATGDNRKATRQTGEPNHDGQTGFNSLWWKWTATDDGEATISTEGSTDAAGNQLDTILAVYTGSFVGALTSVASNTDIGPGNRNSRVTFSATKNTVYAIAVDGFNGATGDIALAVTLVAAAPDPGGGTVIANDNFADAAVLSGGDETITANSDLATEETGEPDHAVNRGGKSLWWKWTVTQGGDMTITTAGSDFNTLLAVYTINDKTKPLSFTNLKVTASHDDISENDRTSTVTFTGVLNTIYYIAVDGSNGVGGNITLNVTFVPGPPPNDKFANAIELFGASPTATADNRKATRETPLEPNHAFGAAGFNSVWWKWTAPNVGDVTISTEGSTNDAGAIMDTLLGVYTPSAGSVNPKLGELDIVARNADIGGGNVNSRVAFTTVAGTVYYIAADGFDGTVGDIVLTITFVGVGPANDQMADAIVLTGSSASGSGNNVDAVKETGEPAHGGNSGGASAWWRWTAPTQGAVTISTAGSDFNTLLAVYTGTVVNNLTAVKSANSGSSNTAVTFNAVNDTTYQIAVDGVNGATGNIALALNLTTAAANDVALNLGPALGVWALFSTAGWQMISDLDPSKIVIADTDASGIDDLIADFGPTLGTMIRANNGSFAAFNVNDTTYLAAGDLDGNGAADIIADFGPGVGTFVKMNNTTWLRLNNNTTSGIVTGDIDGNGMDEAILDLDQFGVWAKMNNTNWVQINVNSAVHMAVANLDGDAGGMAEVVLDLGQYGIWVKRNNGDWGKIHDSTSEGLVTGDIDGNGKADLIADFGASSGLWVYKNDTVPWLKIDDLSPTAMATGDTDANGKDDLIANFGAGFGTRIYRNDSAWETFNVNPASVIATGNLDGAQ